MIDVGDIVNYYEATVYFDKKTVEKKNETHRVLGSNAWHFVINDDRFTTLDHKKKDYGNAVLNVPGIVHMEYTFSNYIRCWVYSKSNDTAECFKLVKKKVESYLYEKYGKYGMYIDLLKDMDF